jgi:hypothetical protein
MSKGIFVLVFDLEVTLNIGVHPDINKSPLALSLFRLLSCMWLTYIRGGSYQSLSHRIMPQGSLPQTGMSPLSNDSGPVAI